VKTGITVILQRERWRNMVTDAGTIAELAWDDLDFDCLTDSLFATLPTARNSLKNIVWESKKLRT